MKKTITISIAGEVFYIEEDAYYKLDKYLGAIKRKFSKDEEKEIIDDIESAIAERFIKKSKGEKGSLGIEDIDEMIEVMGTVEDITGIDEDRYIHEEDRADEKPLDEMKKRLFRDTENEMIAGVCAGLGAYFAVDPTIIRILFIILALFNGIGVIAYLILWVSMPEAKTVTEKFMMKGERVTIEGIKEVSEDRSDNITVKKKEKSAIVRIMKKITEVFAVAINVLIKIFKVFCKIFVKLLGVLLIIGGIFAIIGIIAGFGFGIVGGSALIPQVASSFGGMELMFLMVSIFTILLLPILFVILIGTSILMKKSVFHTSGVIVGLVIWFLAIGGCIAISSKTAARYGYLINDRINAPIITKTYDIGQFNVVDIGRISKVNIEKGEETKISINGAEWILDEVELENKDGKLIIKKVEKNDSECPFCRFVINDRSVEVNIVTPDLYWIMAGNMTQVVVSGFSSDDFLIQSEDMARVEANDMKAERLTITAKDNSSVTVQGVGNNIVISSEDMSSISLVNFIAHKADINTEDMATIKINVDSEVIVMKEDTANVFYLGNPTVKEVKIREVESSEDKENTDKNIQINEEEKSAI